MIHTNHSTEPIDVPPSRRDGAAFARMRLFDSHCHLDDNAFAGDIEEVVLRARRAGVRRMMCAGVTLKTSQRAIQLARTYTGVSAAVGVHPHDVRHCTTAALDTLIQLTADPRVRAWGEIGLDFNRLYSPREDQERWFVRQLKIADALALPIIFHERDSRGRFIELLRQHPNPDRRGVVHCFSGNHAEMAQYLELNFHIGITGIVTLAARGAHLRRMLPLIPADRLLVETDAPYLTPEPDRRKHRRNEPAFVRSVLIEAAAVREEAPAELAEQVWRNTCRLYGVAEEETISTSDG